MLRRVGYMLLTLYRTVPLRSDESRATRWRNLLASARDVLVAASHVSISRDCARREVAAATR